MRGIGAHKNKLYNFNCDRISDDDDDLDESMKACRGQYIIETWGMKQLLIFLTTE